MIKYFIKKSVVTLCLNFTVCILGLFALPKIANEFLPAIEIPAVAIVFPTTVLNTEQIVDSLVGPVEKKLIESGQVDHVETNLETGRAITIVYFNWDQKPEVCLQKSRQIVDSIPRPVGALPPIFVLHRPTLSPILRIVLHGDSIEKLSNIANTAGQKIERLNGVAQVRMEGATPEVGIIEPKSEKLIQHHFGLQDILKSAAQIWNFRFLYENEIGNEKPASILSVKLNSIEDLEELPVVNSAGKSVPLRWIAQVKNSHDEPKVIFGQGEDSLILEIIKAPGADALSIVDQSKSILTDLKSRFPKLQMTELYDEAAKIRAAQADVFSNFRDGIILNSFILIFFLGSISGCIIASAVFPTSLLGTLFILKYFGISFNIFSLNGFSLGVGMITDAGTVLLDSISHRMAKGDSPEESAWKGTTEVGSGVLTGICTSSAVLFPICLQSGISSKLFSDLAITLITTNLLSIIPVFTIVPWLAAKLNKNTDKQSLPPVVFLFKMSTYLVNGVASFACSVFELTQKKKKLEFIIPITVGTVCLGSLYFAPPTELLPTVKSEIFAVSIPYDRKTMNSDSRKIQVQVSRLLAGSDDVEWVIVTTDDNSMNVTMKIKSGKEIEPIITSLSQALFVPQTRILYFPLGPTPPTEPMNYSGFFYLSEKLRQTEKEMIKKEFCETKGIVDCLGPEHYQETALNMTPLTLNLGRSGITPVHAFAEAGLYLLPLNFSSLTNLPFSKSIYLRTNDTEKIQNKPLHSGKNQSVHTDFSSFFNSSFDRNLTTQFRRDQKIYEPLYFRTEGLTIGEAVSRMELIQSKYKIDSDDVLGMGGILNMKETFLKMISALSVATLLVFIIIYLQFKSVIQTAIIMLSIPLAIGGSLVGLFIFKETLNAGVIVGFVLLVGIVVNSGIYLIECLNNELERGQDIVPAILESIRRRVRPILMTKFSCVFGMLPILIFDSEGKELYRGMAIVNIFGLFFGTILTLGVAPILLKKTFLFFNKKEKPIETR